MQLYTIADGARRSHWREHLAFEGVTLLVVVLLAGFLMGLGESGIIAAIILAPLVTVAIFWRAIRGDRRKAIAEYGRYYCGVCVQHFEGDTLRQITQ